MPWRETSRVEGRTYRYFRQEERLDCGLACVATVRGLLQRFEGTLAMIKDDVGAYGAMTAFRASTRKTCMVAAPPTGAPPASRRSLNGTRLSDLATALEGAGIACERHVNDGRALTNSIALASPDAPIIALVQLTGGQRHFIVLVGRSGSDYIVLDPARNDYQRSVKERYGTATQGRATWTPYWIRVTGLATATRKAAPGIGDELNRKLASLSTKSWG